MRFSFVVNLSTSNLRRRKLRSILTIGGVSIGIALVIFLVSLGFGLQQLIKSQVTNAEALTILDVSKGESTLLKLNQDTINEFQNIDSVKNVSPSLSLSGQVARAESVTDVAIYGIDPKFLSMEGVKIATGKEFTGQDVPEILITSTALNLIGLGDPNQAVNSQLTLKLLVPIKSADGTSLDTKPVEEQVSVVGTLSDTSDLSIAYLPIGYLEKLGFTPDYNAAKVKVDDQTGAKDYNLARVKVTDESKLPEVRKQIEAMGYQVDSVADTVGQIDKIFFIFEIVVASFGAIAMFVAAMGALNTLTVSLLERTREIGLMRSLGATSKDIYFMFLTESIVIGMLGGLVGIGIGLGAGRIVNFALNYLAKRAGGEPVEIFYSPMIFLGAVLGLVFIISVVTGLYPSRRAAKINPLDALRYE
ncbi:MAG: FtsX-like permease family protein [Patescibacteria group bacterium]|jgi:putative ABC transport system permease protein